MNTARLRLFLGLHILLAIPAAASQSRPSPTDQELRYWLENMVWHHRFDHAEIREVTGLSEPDLKRALDRFHIDDKHRPKARRGGTLRVLPYPGGRHPRIGFLEGAIDPQRETKLSVFTPWDESSYVVVDVPEAVWSNLGLTYLAHTHIDTVWSKQKITLPALEWHRRRDGAFDIGRTLPNGIRFDVIAEPRRDHVRMRMTLHNGTPAPLSDLRVQMCAMLKGARGFATQTNANKVFKAPFAACRSEDGRRWIIHGWQPCHRTWGNAPCPCLHADPKFPNCAPGETRTVEGWLSFYEGTDIEGELRRIERHWAADLKRRGAGAGSTVR